MGSTLISNKKLFSYIYELEKRRSDRDWHSTYLVKIEVAGQGNQDVSSDVRNFINILVSNMRSEDIIYQWDRNIFLLIICDLNHEEAARVVERISGNYFKNKEKEESGLEIRLWPLKSR